MFKKAVQRGRSERRGEAYSLRYVEPLSDARTKLEAFFYILLLVSEGFRRIQFGGLDRRVETKRHTYRHREGERNDDG